MGGSVRLRVRLSGALVAHAGRASAELALVEGETLRVVPGRVGVTPGLVMLYAVNGAVRSPDYRPNDGDEVVLIPAVAGGAEGVVPPGVVTGRGRKG